MALRVALEPLRSTVVVTSRGHLCLYNKKINLSTSLAGQAVECSLILRS